MINRAAVILKCKLPAVQWINDVDPYEEPSEISLDDANHDRAVYLISDQDAEDDAVLQKWIKKNYGALFEIELEGWYTDESLWPSKRDLKLFYEWFDIECHTVVEDTVGSPIEDDIEIDYE